MISIDHLLLSCLLFVCFFFFLWGGGEGLCVCLILPSIMVGVIISFTLYGRQQISTANHSFSACPMESTDYALAIYVHVIVICF